MSVEQLKYYLRGVVADPEKFSGKMEGFWVEKDHMTYYTYLFPQFHHWCDAKHDFSCSDSTTKKKSVKKNP